MDILEPRPASREPQAPHSPKALDLATLNPMSPNSPEAQYAQGFKLRKNPTPLNYVQGRTTVTLNTKPQGLARPSQNLAKKL